MYKRTSFFPVLGTCYSLLFFACACNQRPALPSSSGKPGEILIVTDDPLWEGTPGAALRSVLTAEYPALPQPEPRFDLLRTPPAGFKALLKRHRNIIAAGLGEGKPAWSVRENEWALDQLVITITAPDASALAEQITFLADSIAGFFEAREIRRIQWGYRKLSDGETEEILERSFGISLCIPSPYKVAKTGEHFAWMRCETEKTSQGIIVYETPLPESSQLTPAIFTALRDSVLRRYIPGPREGTYMTTEHDFTPLMREISCGGMRAVEVRGLWRVEGDFMGGPYVSISVQDTKGKRLLTLEGYVYAPGQEKRLYLRQVEAIVSLMAIIH